MKTNVSYKILLTVPLFGLIMGACKPYSNVVKMVKNNKVLMTDSQTGEERLVDCSKKTTTMPNLLKDLPYFQEGDEIKFKPAKGYTYDGFRAFFIEGSTFQYNPDTIQIRKDKETIMKFKADSVRVR